MSAVTEARSLRARVFRNTLVNGAAMAFGVGVAFFVTPFLVRHLGASQYGLWSLLGAFSVTAGYLSLADLGVQQTAVKLVAEHEARGEWQQVGDIVKASLWLFLCLGLALAVATALFSQFLLTRAFHVPEGLRGDLRIAFFLLAAQVPFELCALPFAGAIEGRQRYGVLRAAEFVRSGLWIIAVVIALPHDHGLVVLAALNLASAILGLALMAGAGVWILPRGTIRGGRVSRMVFRRIFSFSVNVFVTRLTGVLYRQMDRIIIAAALTSVLLAKYEIASKLQMLAALALAFTASAVMPAASSLAATTEGADRLRVMFLDGTKYALAVVLPVTIALMIWADDLVVTWVGSEFTSSIGYTRWFLAWIVPTATTSFGLTMIVGMGLVRQVMYLGLFSAVLNLALSAALVEPLGVLGVIIGTLVGYSIVWYPYMRLFLRTLAVPWREFAHTSVLPVLLVCVPWTAAVVLVHLKLHAHTLAGALGAVVLSIGAAWFAMFFVSLGPLERRLVFGGQRSVAG